MRPTRKIGRMAKSIKCLRTVLFVQDKPYPMNLPNLGHAVIINNVVGEMPGSMEDVQALKTTYEKIGFKVQVHTNCAAQVTLSSVMDREECPREKNTLL